ncbi:MAG: aspartate 1-decarboxylase [Candidatus Marinimicrobia bacterium]|nr:aspartate 1-decarboxylase [Candidatus Neomarinimicrobiota bacterium]|tara:strand:- start:1473 stop:1862 length:390 start_codon:yes stop_codon:yes gene_type:complete
MIVEALKSKIHRACVTDADINYVGSVSIDKDLMEAANLIQYEKVQVLNITNGSRLTTYVIESNKNCGEICINGAAAHLVNPGDLVIIVSYCNIKHTELKNHKPKIVHVNKKNEIIEVASQVIVNNKNIF